MKTKCPTQPTTNATPAELHQYATEIKPHVDELNEIVSDRTFWAVILVIVLCVSVCANVFLGFGRDKNGIDSQKLIERNGEVQSLTTAKLALEKELATAKTDKVNAESDSKAANAEKAKVLAAKEVADKAKSEADAALKLSDYKIEQSGKELNAVKKELEDSFKRGELELGDLKKKLEEKDKALADALKAPKATPSVVVNAPPASSSSQSSVGNVAPIAPQKGYSSVIKIESGAPANEVKFGNLDIRGLMARYIEKAEFDAQKMVAQAERQNNPKVKKGMLKAADEIMAYKMAYMNLADGKDLTPTDKQLLKETLRRKEESGTQSAKDEANQLRQAIGLPTGDVSAN